MRVAALTMRPAMLSLCAALLLSGSGLRAAPIVVGMTGGTAYGVADYGGPPVAGAPTFINNNQFGTNDVLTSPGGGFLTADTSIASNVASFGQFGGPFWSAWTGGVWNGGTFGSGASFVGPTSVGFSLSDSNPNGSGHASYLISSWETTYLNVGAFNGTVGNWLGIAGQFSGVTSAGAVSLVSTVTSNLGYFQRLELVLAVGNVGNYNSVAVGDFSAIVNPGGAFDAFAGLAYNRRAAAFADGEIISVVTTLTAIADPMDMSVDMTNTELFEAAGGPGLADFNFAEMTTQTPEPGTIGLLGAGLATIVFLRRRRAVKQ